MYSYRPSGGAGGVVAPASGDTNAYEGEDKEAPHSHDVATLSPDFQSGAGWLPERRDVAGSHQVGPVGPTGLLSVQPACL